MSPTFHQTTIPDSGADEIDLLLEAVYRGYGYDFRDYARASIERRIRQFLPLSGCVSIKEMGRRISGDRALFASLSRHFSVGVTEMFRDPVAYRLIREQVIPVLKTWPHFKIWHAGCATGEEVYSFAILLKEAGVYDRATLYATDINDHALKKAREGIYNLDALARATRNYQQAGGTESFSKYYHARYDAALLSDSLKERMVFAGHNLASDDVFGEMHAVFCRNVLIYFNRSLQNRALRLFTRSLAHGGFLCLGTKESLRFTEVNHCYDAVNDGAKLYKKRGEAA